MIVFYAFLSLRPYTSVCRRKCGIPHQMVQIACTTGTPLRNRNATGIAWTTTPAESIGALL